MKKPQIIIAALIFIIIVLLVGGGWYLFLKPHTVPASMDGRFGMASSTADRLGAMRGGFATGSIEVLNGNGFTLTLSDSTTKIVTLSATTTIQNYASASSTPTTITSDQLSVGEEVSVIGTANSDGSIDARLVRTGTFPVMTSDMSARGGPRSATSTHSRPAPPTQ